MGAKGIQVRDSAVFSVAEKSRIVSSRTLKLVLTNGVQTVEALEDRRVPQLPNAPRPGTKVTLFGPLTVRRGLVLLRPAAVRVHGGAVEEMCRGWGHEQALEARYGKMRNPDFMVALKASSLNRIVDKDVRCYHA